MEVRLERLGVKDIQKKINGNGLVFLPIAPLEWHSYHLPYGTDPLNAEYFALYLAKEIGGLTHPTLYMGTEVPRQAREKEWFGIEHSNEEVIGMDFPGFEVRSLYWSLDVFRLAAEEITKKLKLIGFRRIVIINGHGAEDQRSILKEIAKNNTDNTAKVIFYTVFFEKNGPMRRIGHADRHETSLAMYENIDLVHIEHLPSNAKLPYSKFGIVEPEAFNGKNTKDYCCRDDADPRLASYKEGKEIFKNTVDQLIKGIRREFDLYL